VFIYFFFPFVIGFDYLEPTSENTYNGESYGFWKGSTGLLTMHQDFPCFKIHMEMEDKEDQRDQVVTITKKDTFRTVIEAVSRNGLALKYASSVYQKHNDIVNTAVNNNGLALEYVSDDLKEDYETVAQAVSQNGMALQYASESLKDDERIVLAALAQNSNAFQYVSDRLVKSEKIHDAAQKGGSSAEHRHEREMIPEIKDANGMYSCPDGSVRMINVADGIVDIDSVSK
jgi:hypothetical protein